MLRRRVLYTDMFKYTNDNLSGELVVLTNVDLSLQEGFDQIDPEDLNDKMCGVVCRDFLAQTITHPWG